MRIRTMNDVFSTVIAWMPLLAIVVGVAWVLSAGMLQLETLSFGTEFFVGNDETTNMMQPLGGVSDEDLLLDALNSGDTTRMAAAVDQVGGDRAALAASAG